MSFGIWSQIIPLKLSFAFCVFPCKHFTNSLSLLNSRYIGLIFYITSFSSPGPGLYVFFLFPLSALNLHQLSGPVKSENYYLYQMLHEIRMPIGLTSFSLNFLYFDKLRHLQNSASGLLLHRSVCHDPPPPQSFLLFL